MTALRFRGPVLPDGEPRDLYVVDGRVTYEKVTGAELGAEGWIVPGLVDAHCHVGLDENGAVPEDVQEEQALTDRDAGALLLRDCGSAADTSWIHGREDLPRLIRAGRHIAGPRGPPAGDPGGGSYPPAAPLHPQLRARGPAVGAARLCRPGGRPRRRLG